MSNGRRDQGPDASSHEAEPAAEAPSPTAPTPLAVSRRRTRARRREFLRLTGGACLDGDGRLDVAKLQHWQRQHGVAATGQIDRATVHAAVARHTEARMTPAHAAHSRPHDGSELMQPDFGDHRPPAHAAHDGSDLMQPDFGDHRRPAHAAHDGNEIMQPNFADDAPAHGAHDSELMRPNFADEAPAHGAHAQPTHAAATHAAAATVAAGAPASGHATPPPTTLPAGYDATAFRAAIVDGRTIDALRLATRKPAQAMTDLAQLGVEPQFFALIRGAKPYGPTTHTQLAQLYKNSKLPQKRELFAAQFSVTVAGDSGAEFSESELDSLYGQARALPPSHVEGQANFVRLLRTSDADAQGNQKAEGTAGGGVITMTSKKDAARYTQVFRHEVGHTVDTTLGAACEKLRSVDAGWKQYGTIDDWITALGGYGDLPAALQPKVKAAIQAYMGAGKTFKPTTEKFRDTLATQVTADELKTLDPYFGKGLLAVCAASQGANNWWRFQSWPVVGDKAFFLNIYYARGYSVGAATFNDLKAWGNTSAAFSDKEWFAEVYADYYAGGVGGKHHHFPAFVEEFMRNKVDPLAGKGAPAAGQQMPAVEPPVASVLPGADGSSGEHPTVPRG